MDELIYRTYQEGDEEGFLSLFKEVFGHDLTMEVWEWKYRLAPGGGPRMAVAQEPGGKIVAAYNVVSLPALIRGEQGTLGQCVDIMVHQRHRGKFMRQGVLLKTFQQFCQSYKDKGVNFLYGFPGRRHWVLGQRTGIYQGGGQVPFFKRDARRQGLSTRLMYSFRPLPKEMLPLVDVLWERNQGGFSTSVVRDSRYVDWRFFNNPRWSYALYLLKRRGGEELGWCAIKAVDGETLLVDFVVPEGLFGVLLRKVEEVALLSGNSTVSVMVPEKGRWRETLSGLGYIPKPTDIYYTTSFMGDVPSWSREQIEGLFYTMGDLDIL